MTTPTAADPLVEQARRAEHLRLRRYRRWWVARYAVLSAVLLWLAVAGAVAVSGTSGFIPGDPFLVFDGPVKLTALAVRAMGAVCVGSTVALGLPLTLSRLYRGVRAADLPRFERLTRRPAQ